MAKAKPTPKIDPLWDVFLDELGIEPGTILPKTQRGRLNAMHQELRAVYHPIPPHKANEAELAAIAREVRLRAPEYRRKNPKVPFTIAGLVGQWWVCVVLRRPKEILAEFVNAWWLPNLKALGQLDTDERLRLFLHLHGKRLRDTAWKDSAPLVTYARRRYEELEYTVPLGQFVKPHVKAAMEKLQAKEAE